MCKKLYILNWAFSYGSASSNRLLAYANSAAAKGYRVEIIALLSLDLKINQTKDGVHIKGLMPCRISNRYISIFLSFFSTIYFLITKVKNADRILLYGSPEYLPLCLLFRRRQLWFELTECPKLFYPKNYPFFIYKKLWKKLNNIIVISKNLKDFFIENGVDPSRILIVNMIVDPSRFNGLERNQEGTKYIAYCGNVNKDSKDGVDDLLHAFEIYQQTIKDRKLYIIGPIVSEEQKIKYEKYLKLSRIIDDVVFIGSVSPSEIPQLLLNAEMLVLARPDNIQAKYGFPTKVGEYLLSGRPNVLTDVGNISDFLIDGENAYIARPGDISSIANKMIEISSNLQKSEVIGQNGKLTALQYFNSDIEIDKLLNSMFKN